MGVMRKVEARLERAVEGLFGRAFKASVQPIEVARKLVKEMERSTTVSVEYVYVPHTYTIYLRPDDRKQFREYEAALAKEFEAHLGQHAQGRGYKLAADPQVLFRTDADLGKGQFGILAGEVDLPAYGAADEGAAEPVPAESPESDALQPSSDGTQSIPAQMAEDLGLARQTVVLISGSGEKEFEQSRIVIGRGRDADFYVSDPNVSRRHAVVYWEGGRLFLQDLDSTNGTVVNGRPASTVQLGDRDVISVGGTEITVDLE